MTAALVALAGAVGAVCRYLLDRAITDRVRSPFPAGTLAVNVVGSAAAGVLAGVVVVHTVEETARLLAGTGFLGAFTTYSTFAVQTVRLDSRRSVFYVTASVVLPLGAAALGYGSVVW